MHQKVVTWSDILSAVDSSAVVPLQTYRIHLRRARIELEGGDAQLFLPSFFGSARFRVPLSELHVCDLSSPLLSESPGEDVYRDALAIPYFFTTAPVAAPTLLLLFATRQRVPPLRALTAFAPNTDLPFGWRSSRTDAGALIDGALLRTPDPTEASRRLVEAGATEVTDPDHWLREHRERIADPHEAQQVITDDARRVRFDQLGAGLLMASFMGAAAIVGTEEAPLALLGLPAAGAVAGFGLRRAADRTD
jgi:hypothetical protein